MLEKATSIFHSIEKLDIDVCRHERIRHLKQTSTVEGNPIFVPSEAQILQLNFSHLTCDAQVKV
jgi:hypothetical protein